MLLCTISFPPKCYESGEAREGEELLVGKLLLVNISNKATSMFNISDPLKPTLLKVLGEICWDETMCSVIVLCEPWLK